MPPAGGYTCTGCITRSAVPCEPSQVTKLPSSAFVPDLTQDGRSTSNGTTNDVLEYGLVASEVGWAGELVPAAWGLPLVDTVQADSRRRTVGRRSAPRGNLDRLGEKSWCAPARRGMVVSVLRCGRMARRHPRRIRA